MIAMRLTCPITIHTTSTNGSFAVPGFGGNIDEHVFRKFEVEAKNHKIKSYTVKFSFECPLFK